MIPTTQVGAKETFSDISGHGAKNDIMYLYEKNIIGGFEDGTFKPNQPITRAQVASMLVKALDYELIENPTVSFKDVTNKSSYYKVLATVNERGIIRGDNGYMNPSKPTTRGQMAAILRRSFDLPLVSEPAFKDVTSANGFYRDINSIAKEGIAGGYPDGTYKPGNSVTRAQFSSFLVRALEYKEGAKEENKEENKEEDKEVSYTIGQKGTAIEQDGWLYTIKGINLVKINQKTKEEVVLLSNADFTQDGGNKSRIDVGFPIIKYNDELYIPYWSSVSEADELPRRYGLMKTSINGGEYEEIILQGSNVNNNVVNRNMYVWNDRIYYTVEKAYRTPTKTFDETVNVDESLHFYSTKLDGSNPKLESTIDARVIFEEIGNYIQKPTFSQDNKSVKYDQSAMYYFNKKGVFKYDLTNGKSAKLSSTQAKDMKVSGSGLEIVDVNGKQHTLKK
jgi:hypothetical protein